MTPSPSAYERLGAFYLGRAVDPPGLLLYDSKDLLTHAVILGMTGSGKTGLALALIEEAAIDSVPCLLIDPKGDLGNLLLTFPELRPEDFAPWTKPGEADAQAERWRKGLAEWGQDGERIRRLREAAAFAIYTPGSSAGRAVSVVKSFTAPGLDDPDLFRERVQATASGLLGLLGIQADSLRSPEHILLATLLETAWREGRDLDLPALIQSIQNPPVQRIGVLELDSFFPARDRFALAVALNNLLASPGFSAWMEGEPLEIQRLLYTPAGKPRVSIFSIAHLSDAERMFFVSLLLSQVVAWVRTQPGTSSLRAILYMDEIFGFFPPTANPPSKTPLLTLMKQARAFGLGVVLATQNPVDLDYKGLANAGTWFIGRLQTERDKERVLEGLGRPDLEPQLARLGNRVFLLHNVHEDAPVQFQTRWALSYLSGPLTREQIKALEPRTVREAPAAAAGRQLVVPPDVPQCFLPASRGATYTPKLLGAAQVVDREVVLLAPVTDAPVPVDWAQAEVTEIRLDELQREPAPETGFAELPAAAHKAKSYPAWSKSFAAWLYANYRIRRLRHPATDLESQPGESERDFRIRVQQAAREARDQAAEKLRRKYGPKIAALEERIRRAEAAAGRERQQAQEQKLRAMLAVGETLLGAFLGRKSLGRMGTAARAASRIRRESGDVTRAEESVAALQEQLTELEAQFETETTELSAASDEFEVTEVRPKKAEIGVRLVTLAWVPGSPDATGIDPENTTSSPR